jgi:type IV secretion system protein VirB6
MAYSCAAPDSDLGLVQSLLGSVDCNVQTLAQAGYGALASPGSPVAEALTIVLTLYIAIMGLRLMLGLEPLRIGAVTVTALKIGVILALATNWPTYQRLVFDTLVKGPEQLGALIMHGLQPPSDSLAANPFAGLQAAYDEMQKSAVFYGQKSTPAASPLMGGSGFAAMALTISAMLMLLETLGALLAAKIVLALLLAAGPVFVTLLLFPVTRGLFEGWLRATLAFAFVPLLAILGLVVQLIMMEPQLMRLADNRALNVMDPSIPSAVFLLSLIFTLVSACLMIAVGVIAFSFRLPRGDREPAVPASPVRAETSGIAAPPQPAQAVPVSAPPRAAQVALAAAAPDRRDSRESAASAAYPALAAMAAGSTGRQMDVLRARAPDPRQRRSAAPRRAASHQRRDR